MRDPHWLAGTTNLSVTGGLLVAGLLLMELMMSCGRGACVGPQRAKGPAPGGRGQASGASGQGPAHGRSGVRCEHAHTRKPCVCTATGRSAQAGLVTEARRPGQAQDDRRGLAETCQRRRAGHRPEGASTQGLTFVLKAWWGMGHLD